MSTKRDRLVLTKIKTGYLIEKNYCDHHAFTTWDDTVDFIKKNPPVNVTEE